MVRCENPARAGPFGGCVPVQMSGTAGNETDTVAGSSVVTVTVTDAAPGATATQFVNSAKFRRVSASQGHGIEEDDEECDDEFD